LSSPLFGFEQSSAGYWLRAVISVARPSGLRQHDGMDEHHPNEILVSLGPAERYFRKRFHDEALAERSAASTGTE